MYQVDAFEDALNEGVVFEARTRDSKRNDHAMPHTPDGEWQSATPTGVSRAFRDGDALPRLVSNVLAWCWYEWSQVYQADVYAVKLGHMKELIGSQSRLR